MSINRLESGVFLEKTDKFHNPDFLTEEIVGTNKGRRLLLKDELNQIDFLPKNDDSLEEWDGTEWDLVSDLHHQANKTYRTRKKNKGEKS
ncbi:MAG: hypothetical protein RJB39_7 [Candidatus Parcubacteria bacterium]|jgi:hypothetical protein